MENEDELFMRRCFDLASLGQGRVSPNPMVGAVLVHEGRVIGEGYHQFYGGAHAEVNAVASVPVADRPLIARSTLYVSLEPCCFFGKTPPCTNLIIEERIPRVVISCLDDTPEVAGKGVAQLQAAGVQVVSGVLEKEGRQFVRPRSVFVLKKRPYVILKFARTRDGYMGLPDRQVWISNLHTQRLVHKWRSEVDAVLVGTQTARLDNPQLTNRWYFGKSPLRIVLDRNGSLPASLRVFDGHAPTLLVTEPESSLPAPIPNVDFLPLPFDQSLLLNLLHELARRGIGILLVEGGQKLLQHFLDQGLWDEARVLTGDSYLNRGVAAPILPGAPEVTFLIQKNELAVYWNRT